MADQIVPTDKLSKQELVEQLESYLEVLVDDIGDGNPRTSFNMLLPVATDAGVFLEDDNLEFYLFDLVADHDMDWEPRKYPMREDGDTEVAMQAVEEALENQINNANKAQLVHYVRWAFNVITRG